MPIRPIRPDDTDAVPIEYSGKWVAWDSQLKQVVATAESMEALWQLVNDKKIEKPVFEKVPNAYVRFVGMR